MMNVGRILCLWQNKTCLNTEARVQWHFDHLYLSKVDYVCQSSFLPLVTTYVADKVQRKISFFGSLILFHQ